MSKSPKSRAPRAYTSNARHDGLTPGQERAIRAMLTARSIAAAARQADVGQSTLRRWLREDDNLRQFREQALSHATLMLQQGLAQAVCIMHELIQSEGRIDPGRVSLIRIALEYAFRSAVYCDIIDRVKILEKAQRQPAAVNPRPAPAEPRNGAARVSKRFPLVRDQPVLEDKHFQCGRQALRKAPSHEKGIFRNLLEPAQIPPSIKGGIFPDLLRPAHSALTWHAHSCVPCRHSWRHRVVDALRRASTTK